jgi:CheY-like chemotaxis protein
MAMRVLVIDDYADAVEVWALYLRASGFDVLTATDGVSGLDTARRERPDVVVMDLQMPGLSGLDVAQALRADDATRHIPLIAVTGRARPQGQDAESLRFDSLVMKPCDPETLVAEIRRVTKS